MTAIVICQLTAVHVPDRDSTGVRVYKVVLKKTDFSPLDEVKFDHLPNGNTAKVSLQSEARLRPVLGK